MKIERVEIEYFIDYIEKTIHLLDNTSTHYTNLLNAISPEFQKKLIEEEHLLLDVLDFDWFCYGIGGLVMQFKDYSLMFVSKKDERLHKPFLDEWRL